MTATASERQASACSLISPELHARISRRIASEHVDIGTALAERIVDQALAFLVACAQNTSGLPLWPSPLVDLGWHEFLTYTEAYEEFCQRVAGRFIHHCPHDDGASHGNPREARARTLAAIQATGYAVDAELWSGSGNCGQGGAPKSCGDDGKGGNPSPGH